MCMGSYAGVDFNLTLCPLQSRLQNIYHGQPYSIFHLNSMPESTLFPSQGLWIWPQIPLFRLTRAKPESWHYHGGLALHGALLN
jgi:hypothetical protein